MITFNELALWVVIVPKPAGVGMETVRLQGDVPPVVQIAVEEQMALVNSGLFGMGGLPESLLRQGIVDAVNRQIDSTRSFALSGLSDPHVWVRSKLGPLYDTVGAARWPLVAKTPREAKSRSDIGDDMTIMPPVGSALTQLGAVNAAQSAGIVAPSLLPVPVDDITSPRAGANPGSMPDYAAYVRSYPDLLDYFNSGDFGPATIEEFGYDHWVSFGLDEGREMPYVSSSSATSVAVIPSQVSQPSDVTTPSTIMNADYAGYVMSYQDLIDYFNSGESGYATIEEFGQAHWFAYGANEGRVMPTKAGYNPFTYDGFNLVPTPSSGVTGPVSTGTTRLQDTGSGWGNFLSGLATTTMQTAGQMLGNRLTREQTSLQQQLQQLQTRPESRPATPSNTGVMVAVGIGAVLLVGLATAGGRGRK